MQNRSGFSSATYILLSITLLLSLYIHHTVFETVMRPGFKTRTPADSSKPTVKPVERPDKKLDLSLDKHLQFDEAPERFDSTVEPESRSPLFETLNKKTDSPVSVSGQVFFEKDKKAELKTIEGAQLQLEIKTE